VVSFIEVSPPKPYTGREAINDFALNAVNSQSIITHVNMFLLNDSKEGGSFKGLSRGDFVMGQYS
jgi:hypothetical protein